MKLQKFEMRPDWGATRNRRFDSVPCGRPQFNTRTNSNLLYRKEFHSTRFRAIFVSDRFIYHRSSLRDYKETMRP
jgi:hypothetical protein